MTRSGIPSLMQWEPCERCSAPRRAHGMIQGFNICDNYRSTGRRRYYVYAVGLWVLIIAIAGGLSFLFPPLQTSLLSFVVSLFGSGDYNQSAGSLLDGWPIFIFGIIMVSILGKKERIYRYAQAEEEDYRLGAEKWSWSRRVWMCLRFGAVHFWNIIISFALVIALAVAGVYLMVIYLRRYRETGSRTVAVAAATHAHVAYNRVALSFFGLVFGGLLMASVIQRV